MRVSNESMLLYVVTDRSWLGQNSLTAQVEDALRAGATFVQLREKELDEADFIRQALEIKAVARRYKVPFVINDNLRVMEVSGADGLHIGQRDMPAGEARRLLGPDKILGVSANTVEAALAAEREGADYLGVGALFSTSTKLDAKAVDHSVVRQICRAVSIPVVGIGGIGPDNVPQLEGLGLNGVAVVSAIFAQQDIYAASVSMLELAKAVAR